VLAIVWVLGVEAFPLHHLIAHGSLAPHDHEHDHAGLAAHVHDGVDAIAHSHDLGASDTHGVAQHVATGHRSHSTDTPSLASFERSPRRHGVGSLAHRQLLFSAPASPVPELAEALLAYTLDPIAVPALESGGRRAHARARGPPRA
jgi:hypothetical protein